VSEFWLGLLALPVLAVAALVVWVLYGAATKAWAKLHERLLDKVKLQPNKFDFDEDDKPEYLDSANQIRDALLRSPKFVSFRGLGWYVILIRDSRGIK